MGRLGTPGANATFTRIGIRMRIACEKLSVTHISEDKDKHNDDV